VLDGVGATERLTREHPDVAIVVLTTYADDETIIAALKAGARGYLTKNADRREISQALHGATGGHTILPPEVTAMLLAGAASAQRAKPPVPVELPDGLTAREAEVLKLLAAGLSNGEIANELIISEHTVKTHINHVFAKTGSRDRAQAIRYAHEHQLT
jgi:DNA-binding NarL/FixJ family response regulator